MLPCQGEDKQGQLVPRGVRSIICASSVEALVNISDNLLKPILLKAGPDKHTYYVIDGLVRYEYVSRLELPAKEERTKDERFQT